MSLLNQLAKSHPYYCSDSNYYSNEPREVFETMTDFLDDFENCDIDLNLCFRWDITQDVDDDENEIGTYNADVFLILQRKGIFKPCHINSISESEAERFNNYINNHWLKIKSLWNPVSK